MCWGSQNICLSAGCLFGIRARPMPKYSFLPPTRGEDISSGEGDAGRGAPSSHTPREPNSGSSLLSPHLTCIPGLCHTRWMLQMRHRRASSTRVTQRTRGKPLPEQHRPSPPCTDTDPCRKLRPVLGLGTGLARQAHGFSSLARSCHPGGVKLKLLPTGVLSARLPEPTRRLEPAAS